MRYYAICDCDSCYASCERVFRPDLVGKPVVVLSNNDGCVVARSKEAKQLGIPMGMPFYQMRERFANADVAVFSSNYELYADITRRVMDIIRDASPEFYRYSIDEAFCVLDGMENFDLKEWGEQLSRRILKWVGMPVSIGIAPTKTLAKCADRFAKNYPGYRHCCVIDTDEKRKKALQLFPVKEVWGIGRRHREHLEGLGIMTAYDFSMKPRLWVKKEFHVTGERTWLELNGTDCIPTEEMGSKKSICTSRSFPGMIGDFTELSTQVSNYAARCAEKLRKQHSVCHLVMVFIDTNHFRTDLPQYEGFTTATLLTPDNATQSIVHAALHCLKAVFRKGFLYKRAGVIVGDISDAAHVQTNFIDFDAGRYDKLHRLDKVIDKLNKLEGSETVVLASQQYTAPQGKGKAAHFSDAIKHDYRSPNYTTRWQDIIVCK
ncbi:MAG: Y-family DNA polymerase [Prevotella sp.]|nr:Y-family DNA polymerase [Prevotella sp.]